MILSTKSSAETQTEVNSSYLWGKYFPSSIGTNLYTNNLYIKLNKIKSKAAIFDDGKKIV